MSRAGKSGYLAGLDGWRALSIMAVMANHANRFEHGGRKVHVLQDLGGMGVYVFFSISGLLICTRLLEEEDLLGRINLRGFYLRRLLRIQPAAIVYLLVVAVVMLVGWFPQHWRYWFGAFFLYRNFQLDITSFTASTQGFLTGHFWTLAVEEHFYLLLSLFLFFVRRQRKLLLGLGLFASLLWPLISNHFFPERDLISAGRYTDLQLQYLLPAAWLAVLLRKGNFKPWATRWLKPVPVITGTFLLAALSAKVRAHAGMPFLAQHALFNRYVLLGWPEILLRATPLWILSTVLQPASMVTRVLEFSWLRWIGRISYSLYLWHVLFFRGLWPETLPQPHTLLFALTRPPLNLLAAVACATASFYLLERPLMRLGHRLAPPATPGRMDMQQEPSLQPSTSLPTPAAQAMSPGTVLRG